MTEISKEVKTLFIIDAIVAFIYAFLYLIIPEAYAEMTDPPYFCPDTWRNYGATILAIAIFCLLAIKTAEWEQVKIFLEFGIVWLILMLCVGIYSLIAFPSSAEYLANAYLNNGVVTALIILNLIIYLREKK